MDVCTDIVCSSILAMLCVQLFRQRRVMYCEVCGVEGPHDCRLDKFLAFVNENPELRRQRNERIEDAKFLAACGICSVGFDQRDELNVLKE